MKKTLIWSSIIMLLLLIGVTLNIKACNACADEQVKAVTTAVNEVEYQDDIRYPQTILHSIVMNFLENPTSENQAKKKVLVLGYDGFNEATLQMIMGMPQSGVSEVAIQGGLYHSYAGANGEQETSTAPGWLSMLSGQWAYEADVIANDDVKPQIVETLLSSAANRGYSSTFISSWAPHFETTYREDIQHPDNRVVFQQTDSDEQSVETLNTILQDESTSSYDVIFAILEYTDKAGHAYGYSNDSPSYVDIALHVDRIGYDLLQHIQERSTIVEEDWLLIITSDHGGNGIQHGGQSDAERNTWFVMNKELMNH